MQPDALTDRERLVLAAVIRSYVETAEPAGSRALTRRFGLGVSPATIRNTMSDLEEKGYLTHPHTSAGRVPTDRAYRFYVDTLMAIPSLSEADQGRLAEEIASGASTVETILRRTAQSLGVLTQELGIAVGPRLAGTILERLELLRLSSEKLMLVLTLRGGAVRSVFIEVPGGLADHALAEVQLVLNERLAGLTLAEVRRTVPDRLRDASLRPGTTELLNIFVQEGERVFDVAVPADERTVIMGQASVLAEQPEFSSGESLRRLLALTETRSELGRVLQQRPEGPGVRISIGGEHGETLLGGLTLVTAEYRAGTLAGVIGVIGPTRMPYEKVVAVVGHASQLVSELLS